MTAAAISGFEPHCRCFKSGSACSQKNGCLDSFETNAAPYTFDTKGGLLPFSASTKSHGAAEEADIQVIIKTRSFLHRRMTAKSP